MNERAHHSHARSLMYAAGLVLCLAAPRAAAVEDSTFIVRTAFTDLVDGVYHLYADIDYGLGERALEALESGVPLTFKVEVLVLRARSYIWDDTVLELDIRYQLVYHPLTDRFVLHDLNNDTQRTYISFRAAASQLGQLSDVPVIDDSRLDEGERYQVRMRVRLMIESLPDPLRWIAYVYPRWRQVSDWYAWTLKS